MTPITTNDVQQAGEVIAAVKAQVSYNWPAISALALWLRVDARNAAEWVISHGGILYIVKKLLLNPPLPVAASRESAGEITPQ